MRCLVGREQPHLTFNECSPRCDLPGRLCINYFIFLILCYFKKPKIWVFHMKNENFFRFSYEISRTYKCWQNNSHFKNTVQPKETLTPTCALCKLWLKLIGDPPNEGASGLRWSLYPIRPKATPIL